MSEASPPDARDPRIERILLQTVPWDVRKKGGLRDLRDLWEKAVRIGFQWGEEQVERARQEGHNEGRIAGVQDALEKWKDTEAAAAARREKDLEEERMWGFEVGWKLCEEKNKVRGPLLARTAVQTDTPNPVVDPGVAPTMPSICTVSDIATQTDVPSFDWAEDVEDLLMHSLPEPSPSLPARDISCLRSAHIWPTKNPRSTFIAHPPFTSRSLHTSTIFVPAGQSPLRLDWDRDPRLHDLSRALMALGWVRSR
ncbi:hypothetical protein B0H14DRAFT_2828260 [Mycena olivaceomarginata]|nr:hypothetical protein B0H14DRAFT_2828260 [Mycena olivaceomarginata]